jgi:hypothetical protein
MLEMLYAAVVAAAVAGAGTTADTGAVTSGLAAAGALAAGDADGAAGTAVETGATLAGVSEPPPPPQATSVVPNAAIAAIRIAKFSSGKVMAGSSEVTRGNDYCPMGISKDYAKARPRDSEINPAVHNFVQIQRNIVDFFTNIIRL